MSDFFINQNPNEKVPNDILPEQMFLEWNEDTYDVLGSVFLREMNTSVRQNGELFVKEHECRFDNLSYKMSGTSDYWWFIMEYNNFIDWQVNSDTKLKIPNFDDIYMLKSSLMIRQNLLRIDK